MFTIDPKDNAKIKYKTEYHKDAGGNITGWSLTETRPDGEYSVFDYKPENVVGGIALEIYVDLAARERSV